MGSDQMLPFISCCVALVSLALGRVFLVHEVAVAAGLLPPCVPLEDGRLHVEQLC